VATSVETKSRYPQTQKFGHHDITFRLMEEEDATVVEEALLRFANSLPPGDLVFLRMDITQPEVVEEWIESIRAGQTVTVLAAANDEIVGYANLHLSGLQWTRHIGEIRVLVSPKYRGTGLGRQFFHQLIDLARDLGLERVVAHVPADQPRVRHMLEKLGFEAEALLADWLKDRNYKTHDLIIMSQHVNK